MPLTYAWEGSLFRVTRQHYKPLDVSNSKRCPTHRWNTSEFGAVYFGCSRKVAEAVTRDFFSPLGFQSQGDANRVLVAQARVVLWEIHWKGRLADMATGRGIEKACPFGEDA